MRVGEKWVCFADTSHSDPGIKQHYAGDEVTIKELYCFDQYNCGGKKYQYANRVWYKIDEDPENDWAYWLMDFIFLKHFERKRNEGR